MMNHQGTFVLPVEVQLRSTFQRSRGIIRKRLAPFFPGTRVQRTCLPHLSCASGTILLLCPRHNPFLVSPTQPFSCVPKAHYHFFSVRERTLFLAALTLFASLLRSFQSLLYPFLPVTFHSAPYSRSLTPNSTSIPAPYQSLVYSISSIFTPAPLQSLASLNAPSQSLNPSPSHSFQSFVFTKLHLNSRSFTVARSYFTSL